MSTHIINNVISVLPVKNFEESIEWYKKLFERDPDIVPMDGVAEWQLVENAWVQVTRDSERAGTTTVIIGVNDVDGQRKRFSEVGFSVGAIEEYPGIIKMTEIIDPEGNKLSFVQDLSIGSVG